MIDPPVVRIPRAAAQREPQGPVELPVPEGLGRLLVLAAVFVCAACGLVYELELVALASYLSGDSVTQASVVLSVMVFAMGIGSLLAKRLRWQPVVGFGVVEAVLALVGGSSAMALYAAFAWFGHSRAVLVAFSATIGVLIGAEVPLLMTLIQRIRKQDAGGAVADLFAADYVGALVGGLAFPFLLLPCLGQPRGALLTGAVNALAGGVTVLWLFRRELTTRSRWFLLGVNVLVLALLAGGTLLVEPFERAARRAVYGADARVAVRTGASEVVVTGEAGVGGRGSAAGLRPPGGPGPFGPEVNGGADPGDGVEANGRAERRSSVTASGDRPVAWLSLFLNGRLRVSGRDAFRYDEALVHPAMAGPHRRVLVLGGGDGLALREVLRHPGVASVTLVEPDRQLVRLARTDPGLSALNRDAFGDRRVRVVRADPFDWLRGAARSHGPYDVVLSDLPDPDITASTKLYSLEFYGLVRRVMAEDGRFAVHAGALSVRPRQFWTVDATLRAAGLRTAVYRVDGRLPAVSRGPDRASRDQPRDWGFVLASSDRRPPPLRLPDDGPRVRSLTPGSLRAAGRAAEGERVTGLPASTLMHPRYLG
ncbi:spermidine synthase [Streptomyces sp. NPDC047108]|uniref:spermidine synthase n=1 Tax=Streptomyces sp. NPDC047108 TaxID=3155025 RepID=UPI0033D47ABF